MRPPLGFFGQSALLIKKNLVLTIKNPKNLIFLVITPFILSLFMAVLGSLAEDNANRTLKEPPLRNIAPFPHCMGKDCISLEYVVITSADQPATPDWVSNTISYIKDKTDLANNTVKQYK